VITSSPPAVVWGAERDGRHLELLLGLRRKVGLRHKKRHKRVRFRKKLQLPDDPGGFLGGRISHVWLLQVIGCQN
jgi:hypothetical protein